MSLKIDIDLSDDYDYENVFINLKSTQLKQFSNNQIEQIILNNGIVFKDDNIWKGTQDSYLSINNLDQENLNKLIDVFERYTNLFYQTYEEEENYSIFVINKQLANGYYSKVVNYFKANYEIDNLNVYLIIDDKISENIIRNYSDLPTEFHLDLNYLTEIKKKNFELILPDDICQIIDIIDQNIPLDNQQKIIIDKFKETWFKLIEDKENYDKLEIKLQKDDKLIEISVDYLTETLNKVF